MNCDGDDPSSEANAYASYREHWVGRSGDRTISTSDAEPRGDEEVAGNHAMILAEYTLGNPPFVFPGRLPAVIREACLQDQLPEHRSGNVLGIPTLLFAIGSEAAVSQKELSRPTRQGLESFTCLRRATAVNAVGREKVSLTVSWAIWMALHTRWSLELLNRLAKVSAPLLHEQ